MQILENRGVVKLFGVDAKRFLQSIITNQIELLDEVLAGENKCIYTYFLNRNGRFLFDSFIILVDNSYILDLNKQNIDKFIDYINFYKFNMDVAIELQENLQICYFRSKPEAKIIYKDNRYNKMGYRMIRNIPDVILQDKSYLEDKYLYSIPDGFIDLVYEKSLPPEYGCDHLNAISYTKGCYVGQEVISRTKYQGVVRKGVFKLTCKAPVEILAQEDVMQDGKKIGAVCSSWDNFAIAILKTEIVDLKKPAQVLGHSCIITKAAFYPS